MDKHLIYICPGIHRGPFGSTYSFKEVVGDDALESALESGYSVTLIEAYNKFKGIVEVPKVKEKKVKEKKEDIPKQELKLKNDDFDLAGLKEIESDKLNFD